MTHAEAKQAMIDGYKVTHSYFTKDEYYYMRGDRIIAEDGVNHTDVFREKGDITAFKEGWSIYAEN